MAMDFESVREGTNAGDELSFNFAPEISATAAAITRTGAQALLPNADNIVVLPAGTSLDDIKVQGRDLVIEGADGQRYVIPDGAVFVPVIVIDGVAVPPLNLAAYLIGEQPQPAAGIVQSSGGNFADPADPIQAAFDLGDLLPYTEFGFEPVQDEEVLPGLINRLPSITFVPRVGDGLGGTEVDEAGLASSTPTRNDETPGTDAPSNSEATSGVITFVSPDGIGSITLNGVVLNPLSLPQTVLSDSTGVLVVTGYTFDPATGSGTISYTYTLTDNTQSGDGSTVSVPISITDSDGDSVSDTLVIRIIDDTPTAFPNTNSVTEGGTVGGNVLTDEVDDIFGADGAATTNPAGGVIGVRAANGDTTSAVSGGTGTQIEGQFGTLTLNANGTYTYAAKPNAIDQNAEDVFVYTIEDGDGDRSTTTLTITIGDVSGTVSDNDAVVDESGLDGIGSQIVPDGEFFTSGQITVTGVSGPLTFTLTSPANGAYGTLTLNADGSYSYTLDTPFDEATANNGRDTITGAESFGYTVTDQNGNVIGSGTIDVSIVDDVLSADADFNTVLEGGTVSGNVLPNDIFGADGATATNPAGGVIGVRAANGDTTTVVTSGTGMQIEGEHGVLILNADGSYTYVADPNIPGQGVIDVFVYTIEDGDGDRSTTTLTITISDVSGTVSDNDVIVDESGLDDIGSQIVPDGEFFTSGQITVGGVSGPLTFTLTSPANGVYGTLTLNADGSYSYTLDRPFDETAANNGRDTITGAESFGYTVTDQNGNIIGSGTIDVNIVDDVPSADADFNTVLEGGSVSGNVLPNDVFGADGATATNPAGGVIGVRAANGDTTSAVNSGTGTQIEGEHGVLILNADGSYTYVADSNIPGQGVVDVFVYTIEDGDGDRSTTTLTITIGDVSATVSDNDVVVDESGLDGIGSQIVPDGEFFTNGQITVTGVSGPFTFTLTSPANGAHGTLTLNADGSYSYTLDTPFDEATANNGRDLISGAESFGYTVTGQNGNVIGSGTIVVNIVDDVPKAAADFNAVLEGNSVNGNVLPNDVFGADGATATNPAGGVIGVRAANGDTTSAVTSGTGTQIEGQFGTLTLNANGSYTYLAKQIAGTGNVVDTFVYTIEDGDGDRSTTTLAITVSNRDAPPPDKPVEITGLTPLLQGGDASVDEDDLVPNGSDTAKESTTTTGSFFISAPDGVNDLTVGSIAVIVDGVFQGPAQSVTPLGNILRITSYNPNTGEVFYSYELLANEQHDAPQAPTTSDENPRYESFTVTLTDIDNDPANDVLVIRIVDDVPSVSIEAATNPLVADESVGTGGSVKDEGGKVANDEEAVGVPAGAIGYATGSLIGVSSLIPGADGEASRGFTLTVVDGGDSGLVDTLTGQSVLLSKNGTVIEGRAGEGGPLVFTIAVNNSGQATLTQYRAVVHNNDVNEDTVADNDHDQNVSPASIVAGSIMLTVSLTDNDGDTATSQPIDVSGLFKFEDDGPSATDEAASVNEGATITGSFAFDPGEDGGTVTHINGTSLVFDPEDDGYSQEIDIDGGTIKVKADGSYSFTANASGTGVIDATFRVTDGDGDTVEADISFRVVDANVPTADDVTATVDDDGLPGGNPSDPVSDLDANVGDLDGPASSEKSFSGLLGYAFGNDGQHATTPLVFADGTGTVGTETVSYSWSGLTLTATITSGDRAGDDLFEVEVTDVATGAYTVTLLKNVLHTAGSQENDAEITLDYTVMDSDGSPADGTLKIIFDDDVPTVSASLSTSATLALDETSSASVASTLGTTNIGNDRDVSGAGRIAYAISGSSVLSVTNTYGADGAADEDSLVYALSVTNAASGLKVTDGSDITLVQEGNLVVGRVQAGDFEGQAAFAVRINQDGKVEVEQYLSLKHPLTSDPNDSLPLPAGKLGATVTITDGDGDSVTSSEVDISGLITFLDDGPKVLASGTAPTLVLDESAGVTDPDGPNAAPAGTSSVTSSASFGTLFSAVNYGADGAGSVSYALEVSNGAGSGLFALDANGALGKGSEILLAQVGGNIVGYVGSTANVFFTISVNNTPGADFGKVTFSQSQNIWHSNTGSDDDSQTITLDGVGEYLRLRQTVTDQDGDSASDVVDLSGKFSIEDDGPTAGTNGKVYLDDETAATPYDTPNLGGTGDYTGTPAANTSNTLAHNFGTDGAGTILLTGAGFADYTGGPGAEKSFAQQLTDGGKTLTIWQVQNGSWVDVVKVELSNDTGGVYTVTQMNPVFHSSNSTTEEEAAFTVSYRVTDRDGDHADGNLLIDVDDDTPTFTGNVQDQVVDADWTDTTNSVATGTLHFSPGADGAGSVGTISAVLPAGLTSNGGTVKTYQDGAVLYGYVEAGTADGGKYTEGQDTKVFTLTIDPDAGASGQYVFDLFGPLDGQIVPVSIGSATSFGAGPASAYVLNSGTGTPLAVVSGWVSNGTTSQGVNGSTNGWGVAPNQNLDPGEMLRFDFNGGVNDWDGAGGFTPPNVSLPAVAYATFNLNNFKSTDTVLFKVYYTGGGSDSYSTDGNNSAYPVAAPAGKFIDYVEVYITEAGASGKVGLTSVGARAEQVDHDLTFQVTLSDGDGDTVQSDQFTVNVLTNGVPQAVAPPIVLDLDGDGMEFLSRADGVSHDYGAGLVATAWVGADDGLLALRNAGGSLKIVFSTQAGETDLEGLAAQYDSNDDGVLNGLDADFAKFGVWQDADLDGVTDEGEFRSLSDMGIVSVGLQSDGRSYAAAQGDVFVHGETAYVRADGSTGKAADASFVIGNERIAARGMEIATTMVAAGVMATALAAETPASDFQGVTTAINPSSGESSTPSVGGLTVIDSSDAPSVAAMSGEDIDAVSPQASRSSISDNDQAGETSFTGLEAVDNHPAPQSAVVEEQVSPFEDGLQGLFADSAPGGAEVMQGLLLMTSQQVPSTEPQAEDVGAVQEVLAEGQAEGFVDQLIAQLGSDPVPATGHDNSPGDLAGLLNSDVATGHGLVLNNFDFGQTIEDAQALAAA